jgi:hypothetical protein
MLFGWLITIRSSPAQEAPAAGQEKPAQDKKPGASQAKPNTGTGMMERMGKMMGEKGGAMGGQGGMQQMMGRMGGGMGMMGQPAKPGQSTEPTLEEMLAKALKDNPDIRVAEAKVREADAELNRTRLQVTQKVLAFHYSRESQKAVIKFAEENMTRIRKLNSTAAISQEDVKVAEQQLTAAKAKLAEIEAEMPYLLGQQHRMVVSSVAFSPDGQILATTGADGTTKVWDAATGQEILGQSFAAYFGPVGTKIGAPPEAKSIADKVRKALETPVTVDYRDKLASEILADLKKKAPGLSIHDLSGISNHVINLQIEGKVPLRTALELLEDTCSVLYAEGGVARGRLSFVLRDYGLLFAPNDSLPPAAVHISNLSAVAPVTKPKEKPADKTDEKGQPEKKH